MAMPYYGEEHRPGIGSEIKDAIEALKGVSKVPYSKVIGQLEGIAELVTPITRTVVSIETIASIRPELGKKLVSAMDTALDTLDSAVSGLAKSNSQA